MDKHAVQKNALSPENTEWQIGKTDASIAFVKEAQEKLSGITNKDHRRILSATIKSLKDGSEILNEHETVEEYLYRLDNHYP